MRPFRILARAAVEIAASARLLDLLERVGGGDRRILRVVTYHRVKERSEADYPGVLGPTPEGFERQVRGLAARFRIISLTEVLAALRGERALPPRALLLTFDDAYRDFGEHAVPVLERLGLPSVLFVPTGFPDRPERAFWWDRLYRAFASTRREEPLATVAGRLALGTAADRERSFLRVRDRAKELGHREAMELVSRVCSALEPSAAEGSVLGWDELRRISRGGVTLCAHSRNHPLLDRIGPDQIREEIAESLADLRREIGKAPPVLAYPGGRYGPTALRIAREIGIEAAFTTHRGVNDLRRADPLQLRRIPVSSRTSEAMLRAQLLRLAAFAGPPRVPARSRNGSRLRIRPA